MCGIVVILGHDGNDGREVALNMLKSIQHRGPDDWGLESLAPEGVHIGMRRLSILDIEGGHQPMSNEDGTVFVVFNGEIYNFEDLRRDLHAAGHRFRSNHSDTEVLVHGYEEWGTGLFRRLSGMFAVAIWDRVRSELVVGRDRFGEKPMYLARVDRGWVIASELRAILVHPKVAHTIDLEAVNQFLAFDFIVGPRTIIDGVTKLPGGHYAVLRRDTPRASAAPYWVRPELSRTLRPDPVEELDRLLEQSVRARLVADVEVGIFLSGGLDSSTIAYYASHLAPRTRAFSIGFSEHGYDETQYSRLVATHLGMSHEVAICSDKDVLEAVPRIVEVLDEPMADRSIFPTYVLCKAVSRHVKVALGGDGSDEFLLGYRWYRPLLLSAQLDRLPIGVRRAVGTALRLIPPGRPGRLARLHELAATADRTMTERVLRRSGSFGGKAVDVLATDVRAAVSSNPYSSVASALRDGMTSQPHLEATAAYSRAYLQEDILVKIDRASMANSLEVRSPFLDGDIVDFVDSLPVRMRRRGGDGKVILRQLMQGRLPNSILDRPKQGFDVPLTQWLRGTLRPLLLDQLSRDAINRIGLLNPNAVESIIQDHLSGADRISEIWPLLMLQMWHHHWLGSRNAVPA
jgi:asparagine synthase (glutamine-hydrolysing)